MYCQKDAANSGKHILLNLNCKKILYKLISNSRDKRHWEQTGDFRKKSESS